LGCQHQTEEKDAGCGDFEEEHWTLRLHAWVQE
jgi:hypothetical protein